MSYEEILWDISWNNLRMIAYSINNNETGKDKIPSMDIMDFAKKFRKGK